MAYYDLGIVIPLEEEIIAFFEIFPSKADLSTATQLCHEVETDDPDVRMIVMQQMHMGKTSALSTSSALLTQNKIGVLVCLGIAGGLHKDLLLGDVCYAGTIADVLDNSKVEDCKGEGVSTGFSPSFYQSPDDLLQSLNFARTQPDLRSGYLAWADTRREVARELLGQRIVDRFGNEAEVDAPGTRPGTIVCGAISKSDEYNNRLKGIDRAVLAIETESGGVFEAARFHGIPALTIRGISDYADSKKGELEASTKGDARRLAALNAASFLKYQISNHRFRRSILARRQTDPDSPPLPLETSQSDPLIEALKAIDVQVDEALRLLSPEYRLTERGYRLPVPRIRRVVNSGLGPTDQDDPILLTEALETASRVQVVLPRTYPDQGLAWVVAKDLLTAEIAGKQIVPVVIDATNIRGRQHTFIQVSPIPFNELKDRDGAQLIFIIENIPFASKHRIDTIISELSAYPDAKFVFIVREEPQIVSESEFTSLSGALEYRIASVPFLEIAAFIEKKFLMSSAEAEVIALRLKETFRRFRLDAHPTYFAGIPREALSALLQANKRAELMQLAVDGFLTFVVAGDRSDIALSRSTRGRFLRRLVKEIHVEKKNFDEPQVIELVAEFAREHDFEIRPLEFINGFLEKGILHFEGGRVHFSLPFIESYLLALELVSDVKAASSYFDWSSEDFDLQTFDLYAEIGAAAEIVERTVETLEASSGALPSMSDADHVLLTEDISPSNLRRPERMSALRKRLKSAATAVREGADKTREKQRILDLTDKIREATARAMASTKRKEKDKNVGSGEVLVSTTKAWVFAVVLLGSGAEHLTAETKRRLATLIAEVAPMIVDLWSRIQDRIDFEALKNDLLAPERLADLPGPDDPEEKKRFISGIVDILEYSALADPLRRVIGFLCEQARHPVLAASIEASTVAGTLAQLFRATWLADINVRRGKEPFRSSIRQLPRAAFLRMNMASHVLARVYWSHSKREDRLTLLDLAEQLIEPLEVSLNKPELKRMIERDEKDGEEKG